MLGLAFLLSGCDPETIVGVPQTPEGQETSPVEFTRGTATIRITSDQPAFALLDRLGNNTFLARYDPFDGGAQAEWAGSDDDWLLTVLANAAPNDAWAGQQATLWIDSYSEEPPLYADGSPCVIQLTELSASGLAGTADCQGLRWLNGYEAHTDPENARPLPNRPPFDAAITFEARP